jgi:hypothetical protein
MRSREELAWAGGLFEGEGCFYLQVNKTGQPRSKAVLSMTDEDVVRRFASAVGLGKVLGPYRHRQPQYKAHWDWCVTGLEDVQAIAAMLWQGLGVRRRARAVQVLDGTPLVKRRTRRQPESLN